MRRISSILPLFLFTISIVAQNANVAVPMPEPAKSTLKARVYYEDTGRSIKRTSVVLVTSNENSREVSGVTDGEGNLEIRNLKAGKYYAVVNAPGVVSPLAYIDFRRARDGEKIEQQLVGFPVIVVNGISDTVTQIAARRGGAISGRVTYSDGDPAIGVRVEILRKVGDEYIATLPNFSAFAAESSRNSGMFITDDRGVYRFAGLPAGEYIVKVTENVIHSTGRRPNYYETFESALFGSSPMVAVFFQNEFEKSKAQPINVELGQENGEINIVIPDRAFHVIEGKIVAAKDKLPIRNARISIKREEVATEGLEQPYRQETRQTSYSDEKGVFKFVELPRGTYKVTVEVDNSTFDEKDQAYGPDIDVETGYAASAANVAANAYGSSSRREKPARKFVRKVQEFTVEDKDLTEQMIELPLGATISGTVTSADGKLLPSYITLLTFVEDSDISSSDTIYSYDYEGSPNPRSSKVEFNIEGVTAGKTFISVSLNDDDFYVKSVTSGGLDLLKDPIDVKVGEDVRNVQVVLARDTGTLKGTVIDGDRQPVPGIQLVVVPTDLSKSRSGSLSRIVRTDENGEFSVKLPPVECAVYFMADLGRKPAGRDKNQVWDEFAKNAPKFKIEAGQTTKTTIKRENSRSDK